MNAEFLVGKTIKSATFLKLKGYDDEPYLALEFTDGTTATISASYGGYSGASEDEYPSFVSVREGLPAPENVEPASRDS
jgi:hypothetical protein